MTWVGQLVVNIRPQSRPAMPCSPFMDPSARQPPAAVASPPRRPAALSPPGTARLVSAGAGAAFSPPGSACSSGSCTSAASSSSSGSVTQPLKRGRFTEAPVDGHLVAPATATEVQWQHVFTPAGATAPHAQPRRQPPPPLSGQPRGCHRRASAVVVPLDSVQAVGAARLPESCSAAARRQQQPHQQRQQEQAGWVQLLLASWRS